jgi:hypothetical protein
MQRLGRHIYFVSNLRRQQASRNATRTRSPSPTWDERYRAPSKESTAAADDTGPCLGTDVGDNAAYVHDGALPGSSRREHDLGLYPQALERAWLARPHWRALGLAANATFAAKRDHDPGRTVLAFLTSTGYRQYGVH